MVDQRTPICTTCYRIAGLNGNECADPQECRRERNEDRKTRGLTPLIGELVWYHSPYWGGTDCEETRMVRYITEKHTAMIGKYENELARIKSIQAIGYFIALVLFAALLLATLQYRSKCL